MFRRLQLNTTPAAFWRELMSSAGDGGKVVLQLKRAEVPPEVRTRATPKQLAAAWTAAARRSALAFLEFADTAQRSREAPHIQKLLMLEMKHVGIKCEGRSGPYDLMYFPHRNAMYAAHCSDDSIVYVLA